MHHNLPAKRPSGRRRGTTDGRPARQHVIDCLDHLGTRLRAARIFLQAAAGNRCYLILQSPLGANRVSKFDTLLKRAAASAHVG
jgi:hypothetical protein